jgi:hypothetical protein
MKTKLEWISPPTIPYHPEGPGYYKGYREALEQACDALAGNNSDIHEWASRCPDRRVFLHHVLAYAGLRFVKTKVKLQVGDLVRSKEYGFEGVETKLEADNEGKPYRGHFQFRVTKHSTSKKHGRLSYDKYEHYVRINEGDGDGVEVVDDE